MKKRRDRILILLLMALVAGRSSGATDLSAIEQRVEKVWRSQNFPSLSFALVGRRKEIFHSYIAFAPSEGVGVILLANSGRPLDELGKWMIREAIARVGEERPPEIHDAVRKAAGALVPYFAEEPPDSLAGLFHPQFLAEIPLAKVKLLFSETFERYGPCGGVELKARETPRRATLLFKFGAKGRDLVPCEMGMDAGIPPRINYLYFPPR